MVVAQTLRPHVQKVSPWPYLLYAKLFWKAVLDRGWSFWAVLGVEIVDVPGHGGVDQRRRTRWPKPRW